MRMVHTVDLKANNALVYLSVSGILTLLILGGVPQAAAASGVYSEDFLTTTFRDSAATNATGWATGSMSLPHRAPVLLGTFQTFGPVVDVCILGKIAYVLVEDWGLFTVDISDPKSPSIVDIYNTDLYATPDLCIVGDVLYVVDWTSKLTILSIRSPPAPNLLGHIAFGGYPMGVCVVGSTAYVTNGYNGLQTVNVTDSRNPTLLGTWKIPSSFMYHVCVVGTTAYVADGMLGLLVLNVTDSRQPVLLGSYRTPSGPTAVDVAGSIAYLADGSSLQVVNVTDPSSPTLLGSYDTPGGAQDICVVGTVAYVASQYSGLLAIDVLNPKSPKLLDSYDTPGDARGICVDGEIALVADYESGLAVLDVTDLIEPSLDGSYDTPGNSSTVWTNGRSAYVADGDSGLLVINVTSPTSPDFLGSYDTPGCAVGVCVVGPSVYVADGNSGLQVINATDPRNPTLLSTYDTPGYARSISVFGTIACVADGYSGLQIINVTDQTSPSFLGTYDTPGYTMGLWTFGKLVCIADGYSGLSIVDISNPRGPALVSTEDTPGFAYAVCVGMSVVSDAAVTSAFVADGASGLQVLNLNTIGSPVLVGNFDTPAEACGVYVNGQALYVTEKSSGLQVFNASDPWSPELLDSYDTLGSAYSVCVAGEIACIADGSSGLQVLEVQRNHGREFEPCAVGQSLPVASLSSGVFVQATLSSTETVPTYTDVTYYLSPDNGTHWEKVTPGIAHVFVNVGNQLKWRVILTTNDSLLTPAITTLSITYETRLNAPALITPGNGAGTNDSTPTLQWSSLSGASGYLLQLDTAPTFDSVNLRNVTLPGGTTSYTPTSPLADGTWYWRVGAIDLDGQLGALAASWILHVDTTPPTWDQTLTNRVSEFGSAFSYDLNASDNSGIDHYWLNDTVHFTVSGAGVLTNKTALSVGIYGVQVRAYDPYTNYRSASLSVTVQDTSSPTWVTVPGNQIIEYGQPLQYRVTAWDLSGINLYSINSSDFGVDTIGLVTNSTRLAAGIYWLEVRAYDSYMNYCSATFGVVVQGTITTTTTMTTTTTVTTTGPPDSSLILGLGIGVGGMAVVIVIAFLLRRKGKATGK